MERVQEHKRNALDHLLGDINFEKANQDQEQTQDNWGMKMVLQDMDVPRDATIKSTKQESRK